MGNSSEFKNCVLLDKVQVPHYNYIGDSILGYKAHTGAGTICSNLKSDGKAVVIHGDEDRVVPCEMSESIEKNSPLVERHVFKGAGHALCFYSDNEKYQKIVGKFKDKCLK